MLAMLLEAYSLDGKRTVLNLNPKVAPFKMAVFPLMANKPKLVREAKNIYDTLKPKFAIMWDDIGNVGKRYFRQDEIGTPWCITVDYQTLNDETVTIRDRETTKQIRVKTSELEKWFEEKLR